MIAFAPTVQGFFFCTKRKDDKTFLKDINVKEIFLMKKEKTKNHDTSFCLGGNCILGFIVLVVYKTCYSF